MMKTCGDCIHADVCENRYSWLSQEDNTKRIICHHFKAKTDVAQQKWIPVTERLPERDELVLCVGKKGGMFLGEIHPFLVGKERNEVYCYAPNSRHGRYARYWMPLPQPPKEGE